jgi:uncharacterized membrane protein YbhN (UPF0104 family)
MNKSLVKKILIATKICISILLVYFLVDSIGSNMSILDSLKSAKLEWIAYAIILMIPNVLFQAMKWWLLLKQLDPTITFWSATGSTLGGLSLGFLTPGRIGEIAKGLFIGHVDRLKITGLAVIDRIFNMLSISSLGLFAIGFLLDKEYDLPAMVYGPPLFIACSTLIVIIYVFIHPRFLKALFANMTTVVKLRSRILQFFSSIMALKKRTMLSVLCLSTLVQCIVATQFIFMIYAFVDPFPLFEGYVSSFATAFTKAVLPISIADIGVRETAADLYFGFFVKNRTGIFNGTLLLFLINVVFPAICGLIMLPKLNFQKDLS